MLAKRLSHWFPDDEVPSLTNRAMSCLTLVFKRRPPCVGAAYLRTLCNGWCTSTRLGQVPRPCRLCGAHVDRLAFMWECNYIGDVWTAWASWQPVSFVSFLGLDRDFNTSDEDDAWILKLALSIYLSENCYNTVRHEGQMSRELFIRTAHAKHTQLYLRSQVPALKPPSLPSVLAAVNLE